MLIFSFLLFLIVILILIAAIALNIYASSNLTKQVFYATNTQYQGTNTLIYASYIILIIVAILLLITFLAAIFSPLVQRGATGLVNYGYTLWLMVLILILIVISAALNLVAYFQLSGINIAGINNYLLTSTILIFILFIILFIYLIYNFYYPTVMLPPVPVLPVACQRPLATLPPPPSVRVIATPPVVACPRVVPPVVVQPPPPPPVVVSQCPNITQYVEPNPVGYRDLR